MKDKARIAIAALVTALFIATLSFAGLAVQNQTTPPPPAPVAVSAPAPQQAQPQPTPLARYEEHD